MPGPRILLLLVASIAPGIAMRSLPAADTPSGHLSVTDLRCEHLVNPLGIDDSIPRLSWKLAATTEGLRGLRQSAFQVLVASDRLLLDRNRGDLWDSGRVSSDRSHLVSYEGQPLNRAGNAGGKFESGMKVEAFRSSVP